MAYNSFNKILFLSSIENIGKIFSPNEIPFYAFNLNCPQEDLALKLSTEKTEQPFCIQIEQKGDKINYDSLNHLILCLAHPYYFKENAQHVLLVPDADILNNELTRYLQLQGFTFHCIETTKKKQENNWILTPLTDISLLQKEYEKKLTEQQFINKWIIITYLLPSAAFSAIKESLNGTENKLKQNIPTLATLALATKKMQDENNLLWQKIGYLTRELGHYKVFNQQLKEQDESEKILQFYHREYEQLPLWYKRFGHIIKVITGKRKLSSLFKNKSA